MYELYNKIQTLKKNFNLDVSKNYNIQPQIKDIYKKKKGRIFNVQLM